jgi:hypothetical protein
MGGGIEFEEMKHEQRSVQECERGTNKMGKSEEEERGRGRGEKRMSRNPERPQHMAACSSNANKPFLTI